MHGKEDHDAKLFAIAGGSFVYDYSAIVSLVDHADQLKVVFWAPRGADQHGSPSCTVPSHTDDGRITTIHWDRLHAPRPRPLASWLGRR